MSTRLTSLLSRPAWLLAALLALLVAGVGLFAPSAAASDAPPAPATITVTRGDFGHGVLNVSWRAVKDLVLYNVRYSDDGGQTWEEGPSRVHGTSASITGVNDALPYFVAVQSHNGKAGSAWTQSGLVQVECPKGHFCKTTDPGASDGPAAPATITVTRGDFGRGVLNVSWRAVKGFVYYNVRYTDDGGQTWEDGPTHVQGTSASITGVNDALPYFVAVQSHNGKAGSAWTQSGLVQVECPDGHACKTGPSTTPPAPATITVTRGDFGRGVLNVSWRAVRGVKELVYYNVRYTDDGGQTWENGPSRVHGTSASITGVNDALPYIVAVQSHNGKAGSAWTQSGLVQVECPKGHACKTTAPGAVDSVSLTRADGSVTASWGAVDGATSYHVTYSDNGGSSWSPAALNHTGTSITISADNARTYAVGVRARNSAGDSGWRNSPSAGPYTPPAPDPTPTPTPATDPTPTPATDPTPTPTPTPTPATDPTPTPTPTPKAPGIIVQDGSGNSITALSVPEGGEASYQVKLASQPTQDVKVRIDLSVQDNNDSDITFKGQASDVVAIELDFTPENWNTAQTVTLVAAEDNDVVNGTRDVGHDARLYFSGEVTLTATEVDNGRITPLPAAPTGFTATAGDGSVTLSWDDPSDSSITGYEYNVNHNDTGTGNLSGWSAWTAIAGSGAATTSHTFTGLTNGREYRYHLRAVNAGGAGAAAPNAAPWYVSATPLAPSPSRAATGATVNALALAKHTGAAAILGVDLTAH